MSSQSMIYMIVFDFDDIWRFGFMIPIKSEVIPTFTFSDRGHQNVTDIDICRPSRCRNFTSN